MVVKIEIMKTMTCPFCQPATEIVKKVAKEFGNKAEVKEIYLDQNEQQMMRAKLLGIKTVPVILVQGLIRFTGVPREELLKEAIRQELKKE